MAQQEENKKRGLGSADEETRQRVAGEGGKASHGGGSDPESADEESGPVEEGSESTSTETEDEL